MGTNSNDRGRAYEYAWINVLYEGWQLSFRIHNASTKVEPSLKFDVQFIGMPVSVLSIECRWKQN